MNELNKEARYCVYKHTSPSGKIYIGITSKRPIDRWGSDGRGYLAKNKNGEFRQPAMANAVIKYSNWDEWMHEIIAIDLTSIEAKTMEQELIDQYKSTNINYGYNISPGGECPKHSEETKRKISESHKGRCASDETRLKMSLAQKQRWDQKARDERSKQYFGDGNPMYDVHRYGDSNPMFGKKHSLDTKKKISDSKSGKNNPSSKQIICVETGVVYCSAGEAGRITGIKSQNILACCNHMLHRKTAGGFRWEFYDIYTKQKEDMLCVS